MKQKFELGTKVYVFRTQKGKVSKGVGIIKIAEINTAGYIQYSVDVITIKDGKPTKDLWVVNHASMATTQTELDKKADTYAEFNKQQHDRYIELFGAPEFDIKEIEKQLGV